MKKKLIPLTALATLALCLSACSGAKVTSSGSQVETSPLIYGTMQIPYAEFYAAEGVSSPVDLVSSCTTSKWNSESFNAGSYVEAHAEDEGGNILGVVYPVALTEDALNSLGDNSYGFVSLDAEPSAYKTVDVADGKATFSAIQGNNTSLSASVVLKTATVWGDYEIDIDAIHNKNGTSDIGTIYGALLRCSDGSVYAMRHLENIWLDELSWSCGILTVEPHKNVMNSEMYADMMGKTITEISYITPTGYNTISTELYVPVKFVGGITVANAKASDTNTSVSFENLPSDFVVSASVAGLDAQLHDTTLSFSNALPGLYTLTVSDNGGKYADLTASFILSTDSIPVTFDASTCTLTAGKGRTDDLAHAFLSNISSVVVNETSYAASGRGAVAIIDKTGAVDLEAALVSGKGDEAVSTPIFGSSGDYSVTVNANGFPAFTFTLTVQ